MKLKIAVCNDRSDLLYSAKQKLQNLSKEYEVDSYESGVELIESDKEYDIVILDIEMKEMNGLEVAVNMRKKGYKGLIIFLTEHAENRKEDLKVKDFQTMSKAIEMKKTNIKKFEDIKEEDMLPIKKNFLTYLIKRKDIIYLEKKRNYTYIKTIHETIETKTSLREWMKILGTKEFCQIHRSYIVPLFNIKKIEEMFIQVENADKKIPISKFREKQVKKAYFDYLEQNA